MVAHASGRQGDALVTRAVQQTVGRTQQRPLLWHSDGWRGYRAILVGAYRRPQRTGRRGRPPLVVPADLRLTQIVKHRNAHGHLASVAVVAALGAVAEHPGTVHVERLNGTLRDRVAALTRKTHAFAKREATWDALLTLALWSHNRVDPQATGRAAHRSSPAMALGITEHRWSLVELLTTSL